MLSQLGCHGSDMGESAESMEIAFAFELGQKLFGPFEISQELTSKSDDSRPDGAG